MTQSSLFKTNKTQAVRLPKEVSFPDHVKRVEIVKQGNGRLITPVGGSWDSFFESAGVSDDFMTERVQPPTQDRRGL